MLYVKDVFFLNSSFYFDSQSSDKAHQSSFNFTMLSVSKCVFVSFNINKKNLNLRHLIRFCGFGFHRLFNAINVAADTKNDFQKDGNRLYNCHHLRLY